MDSRLREIEQWVLDAKSDLSARGQEAYIRKLFLLDAEIKAVIKESGLVPEAYSPGLREKRVRRFSPPVLATAASLGVLLLTTTTVLATLVFTNPPTFNFSVPERLLALAPPRVAAPAEASDWRAERFVPASPYGAGDILLDANTMPLAGPTLEPEPAGPAELPSAQPMLSRMLLATGRTPAAKPPAVTAVLPISPGAVKPVNRDQEATEVKVLEQVRGSAPSKPAGTPAPPRTGQPAAGGAASTAGGMQGVITRMTDLDRFGEFPDYDPEEPMVNEAKLLADQLLGITTDEDCVDNSESGDAESHAADSSKTAEKTKKSK